MAQKLGLALVAGFVTAAVIDFVVLLTTGMSTAVLLSTFLGGLVAGSFFIEPIKGGGKAGITIALVDAILVRPSIAMLLYQMGVIPLPEEPLPGTELSNIPFLIVAMFVSLAIELSIGFGGGFVGAYLRKTLAPVKPRVTPGVCPYCGAKVPPEAIYCPYCGAKLKEA